jgi:sugar lactone lactonase YvrE
MRILKGLAVTAVICVLLFNGAEAFAREPRYIPYTTYTYSYGGEPMESPDAYIPVTRYTGTELRHEIRGARGMAVGPDGRLYIADTSPASPAIAGQILVYDEDFRLITALSQFVDFEIEAANPDLVGRAGDPSIQTLFQPEGVFVDHRNHVFVADTGNRRILEFKWVNNGRNLELIRQIGAPVSDVLREDFLFLPANLVVDTAGRMFVLVKNCTDGIVQLDRDGSFTGFFGAQKTNRRTFDAIREFFMTEEQRERTERTVPRQYNSIAIDPENFIWLTTDAINWYDINNAIARRARETDFMPIKRMNLNGDDVLIRGGIWPPAGDVVYWYQDLPSAIVDIALKDSGIYSVVDRFRNKIFTYDDYGNLLYGLHYGVRADGIRGNA